jgi:hypothetical protein
MELLCSYTDLALSINPDLPGMKDDQLPGRSIRIVTREDLVRAKKAAGRDVDLEDVRILELPDEE